MPTLDSRVILRSFTGTMSAPPGCREDENYWALIGSRGTVVEPLDAKGRLLVRFDESVAERGLQCHNAVPNSLYLLASDLEIVP